MKKIFAILSILFCNELYTQPIDSIKYNYTWDIYQDNINHSKGKFPPADYLLRFLNTVHFSSNSYNIPFSHFNKKLNVTKDIKNKILSILKNEWTFDEVKTKWEMYKVTSNSDLLTKVGKAFKATHSSRKANMSLADWRNYLYDSLAKPYKDKMEAEIYSYKVPNCILLAAAWIDLKEAMPTLKEAYISNSTRFDKYFLQVALAKLGDKDALNSLYKLEYVFKNPNWHCNQEVSPDYIWALKFVGTQESIYQINQLLDTTYKCSANDPDYPNATIYASARIIDRFKYLFINPSFQLITNYLDFNDINWKKKVNSELILKFKNWIISNKGKYKLNEEIIMFQENSLQSQNFPKLW